MAVHIAPVSWGLGDLIVSLPAIQSLIDRAEEVVVVTRSDLQQTICSRIEGIAASIPESELKQPPQSQRYYNLRAHPLQTDYWWGSDQFFEKFPDFRINDILRTICDDFQISPDFENLRPLRFHFQARVSDRIALIPGSDGPYKCWPLENWLALVRSLTDNGLQSFVIGQPHSSPAVAQLLAHGVPWLETESLTEALDVVSSCRAAIGIDTGLLHIAVQQGVPAVGIFKKGAVYVRPSVRFSHLEGLPCADICKTSALYHGNNHLTDLSGCSYSPRQCSAAPGSRCMDGVAPDMVAEKTIGLLHSHRMEKRKEIHRLDAGREKIGYRCVSSNAESLLRNSQEEGIGHVAAIDGRLFVNNLGRNLMEMSPGFESRVLLNSSIYEEDEPSQFDTDIHAILRIADHLYVINHFGLVRIFEFDRPHLGFPTLRKWPGDCEHFVAARGSLISTSPGGYMTDTEPCPGLLVSSPIAISGALPATRKTVEHSNLSIPEIPHTILHGELLVKAVAVDRQEGLLAAADGGRIVVFALKGGQAEALALSIVAELSAPYTVTFLHFTDCGDLIAAGHDSSTAGDQDWNDLQGGGFCVFGQTGIKKMDVSFEDLPVAWGNSARTVVIDDDCNRLLAFDRFAQLYSWSLETGERRLLWRRETEDRQSLGIAHAAIRNGDVICGFNRGGYRLHVHHPAILCLTHR